MKVYISYIWIHSRQDTTYYTESNLQKFPGMSDTLKEKRAKGYKESKTIHAKKREGQK